MAVVGWLLRVAAVGFVVLAGGCADEVRPEPSAHRELPPPIHLGRARTADGVTLRLSSIRDAGGPCLLVDGLPGGTRGCGRAPSERVPASSAAIDGDAFVRRRGEARMELYGATAPEAERVVVRFREPCGRRRRATATLIHAGDQGALARAGIRKPLGYFVSSVPREARRISAEARGRSGLVLGRTGFDRLVRGMHPTVFILRRAP
jgi:hypothetical protein